MKPYKYIPVAEARPAIRKVIGKGGSALVKAAGEWRYLQHMRSVDRPRGWLPWPLSKLQPRRFTISTQPVVPGKVVMGIEFPSFTSAGPTNTTEYQRHQIEKAIDMFLDGCSPDDEVSILHDPNF